MKAKYCSNCGYGVETTVEATFCARCGNRMKEATDSRDVCPEERQKAFDDLEKARDAFRKAGGKLRE